MVSLSFSPSFAFGFFLGSGCRSPPSFLGFPPRCFNKANVTPNPVTLVVVVVASRLGFVPPAFYVILACIYLVFI
jgi:hypothetical protein